MFTGIIEQQGRVKAIETDGGNIHISIETPLAKELKVDQSVAHNGVCLTVIKVDKNIYQVTAVAETLNKSNLGMLRPGDFVNLERCMINNSRFDGHIVQGHVDEIVNCTAIDERDGSWQITFELGAPSKLLVEKGAVTINGISLTCFDVSHQEFSVAVIPYTFKHTNLGSLTIGDSVNIEFDIIGKYVAKMMSPYQYTEWD